MKRSFITFGLLVAAAFALTNCTQKESYAPVQEESGKIVDLQFVAELPAETKTVNQGLKTLWEAGDQVKLSYSGQTIAGDIDAPFTTVNGDGLFTGKVDLGVVAGVLTKVTAVYPYTEEGGIVIPKSTEQKGYDSMAHLSRANCPLYGEVDLNLDLRDPELWKGTVSIPGVKLQHATAVVQVNVKNTSKSPIVIEQVGFRVGSDMKGTTKVIEGASLEIGQIAKIYIVTEPSTVAAGEKLVFWVNDTAKEIAVEKDITFTAGEIKQLNFAYEGDFPELYAVADVDVEMTADRIVPSVKTLIDYNYLKEWASNLKNTEDCEALLQDVLIAVTAGDLEAAYDVLGGIPGFERQFEIINGTARHIEKVNYTASDYLNSFVEEIKKVKDLESLLSILDEFMRYYEVSGTKDQVLGGLGKLSDYAKDFTNFITQWIPNGGGWLGQMATKWIEEQLDNLLNVDILAIMTEAVADPDSIQAKILNWMLGQTAIRDALLDSIVKIVEGIEDASKDQIDLTNQAMKEVAIAQAKATALYKAKIAAHMDIEDQFNALNQAELDKLNKTPWRIFKMILDWDKTKSLFEELQIQKVYDIFQELAQKVEERVIFEEGPYQITSETCEVLTPSQLAE